MTSKKIPVEPYKIKMVEPLFWTSRKQRDIILKEANFNVFNIPADKVTIDLLTDSGTSAMSDRQWASLMMGDESYAGSRSFFRLERTVRNISGYTHVIPVHQGRAAERVLFGAVVKKGDYVPNNTHFETTKANITALGAFPVNCPVEEAENFLLESPFKGNMDVTKLQSHITKKRREKIPLVLMTITNNSAAGQPVSLDNIRRVSRVCREHKIPFFFDACRFAENAYFIKRREKGFARQSILAISRKMFALADGAFMSAKKDALANIGGWIALNDGSLALKLKNIVVTGDGFPTYGGLAGRDLEAMAQGLEEVLKVDFLEHRIGQVRYLGELIDEAGIPVYRPFGGHAVFVRADKFLPHIPLSQFPGLALAAALYRQAGIRSVGRVDYLRLSLPRRVYTVSHLQYTADALRKLYRNREKIRGLKILSGDPQTRHLMAGFEEV
jgi:tyrosine phenol-lyase